MTVGVGCSSGLFNEVAMLNSMKKAFKMLWDLTVHLEPLQKDPGDFKRMNLIVHASEHTAAVS